MWTCNKCKRSFRNTNQRHSCVKLNVNDFFIKRPDHLKALFVTLKKYVSTLGSFVEEAVPPDVIRFKTVSTFLSVKVKSKHLEITFYLDYLDDVPPVSKYLHSSKNRVIHLVAIDSEEDIDKQLEDWICYSHNLING